MNTASLSDYVKQMRKEHSLTQIELSEKSGVGLRFVRELEQGKQTLRLDKVNQVLNLFGAAEAISLTMPLSEKPYNEKILFPFFDGLIPEGWLLEIAEKSWKINRRDRMSLLLACCKDCIGSVCVVPIINEESL